MKNRASKAGLLGCVLIASGVLLAALAVFFVPESVACLPGFKPKPGVTNPTVNERDCEPITTPSTPSAPAAPPSATKPPARKAPPVVPPSVGREKAEQLLRDRLRGDEPPPQPQPTAPAQRPEDTGDAAIKRLGEKLRGRGEGLPAAALPARPGDDG